jgi:UDP-hydrolysing UDP-N-acetyl-D-glucosamine 2-epimerase
MGGEVTGTIDESIRHAITKLAHVHFPANRQAAERILRLGEDPSSVHLVGCPRMDLVAEVTSNGSVEIDADWLEREGVGGHLRIDEPFLLVSQHPVTTEYGRAEEQITETLLALKDLAMPTIMLWPNVDAGSEDIARGMRKFREHHRLDFIRFYKNFPVETYLRLMKSAACLVGNSSSSIREGAFLGTPAVNIGSRQDGRERGPNVIDAAHERAAIAAAVRRQVAHGPYPPAHIYGDGKAGARIAEVLARTSLHVQKRIQY